MTKPQYKQPAKNPAQTRPIQPGEYDDTRTPPTRLRALWAGVMRQAVVDANGGITYACKRDTRQQDIIEQRQRNKELAVAWLGSRGFYDCCDLVGVDPAWARQKLGEQA